MLHQPYINIPEDKSLDNSTNPDNPTEETVSKTITMNFVWGDADNHFSLMHDGSDTVHADIDGQTGSAVTTPTKITLTEKRENNQWTLVSAISDNPNVKVTINRSSALKPKVDVTPVYHGMNLTIDSKAPLSESTNEFNLDLNPTLTSDQVLSALNSSYTTKVYVPVVKFSINYRDKSTGKIVGQQLYQGELKPDGTILKLNNQVPDGYQLDPNHSGDQVRWNGDDYTLELHKQSGWATITNEMGKPDTNGNAVYTNLLTELVVPISKASVAYQFVDDDNSGANVGNQTIVNGDVGSTQSVFGLSIPTNYQLATGQSIPTSVQIPQNGETVKIHLVHQTQPVTDSKTINRIINVTDPTGKVKTAILTGKTDETVKVPVELPANYHVDGKTPTDYTFKAKDNQDIVINLDHDTQTISQSKTVKRTIKLELPGETDKPVVQQVTFTRHGIKDLVTGKTTWGSWDHNGKYQFNSYTPQTISGYEADPKNIDSLLVTPDSKDSELTINYHKLVAKPTVKRQAIQKPTEKAINVQQPQASQLVIQSKSESRQELPQTGNDNETALASGFMGLLLVIGSLGFSKKNH